MSTTSKSALLGLCAILAWASPGVAQTDTVGAIKSRGDLICGTSTGGSPGLSTLDDKGAWAGLEVDYCRALAAAILGNPDRVKFAPLEFKNAFAALTSGSVDLLARTATWTFTRDVELRFDWPVVYLHDGQGFMVRKSLGVKAAKDLDGASICVTGGSTTELNLADFFRAHKLKYIPIVASGREQNIANLEANRCDAYSNERGGLAANRSALPKPDDYVILPDVVSKEPTGPVVRQDDARFRDIVAWTFYALVIAEEFGVTRANVIEQASGSDNPEVQRLLGKTGEFGSKLGLANDWAVKVISAAGNYGEIYNRNLGADSRIKLARGQNELWKNGGLIYAPPMR
ncbi:amino acid ABC transporter substrate-binding protein [Terrarubrum flagellatum]|uniref:amino acid ABC transporter substrate-binding protein n=1 Tax=Terrirubrum flagellatum TaxID=2895980 RepID=UPI0031452ABC